MAIQWFYQTSEGQQSPPVDSRELRRLVEAGIVSPDTLVRQGGGPWESARNLRGLWRQSDSSALRAGAASPGSAAGREFTPLSPPPLENAPAFDPHYVWLGIPPGDRPLSHYRLLGIADFEDNAEVISNAADKQMAHVHAFQIGEHAEACQNVLNELAAARVCLLSPAKKAFYDGTLQRSESAIPLTVPRLSVSQVQQEAELVRRRVADREREPKPTVSGDAREKPERVWPVTWAAIIVGSGTVLLLLWAIVFRGGSEPQQQADDGQWKSPVVSSAKAPPAAGVPSPLPASDPAADGVRRILRRARAHLVAGDYDSAIADYTQAIRLDPTDASAYYGRGLAYFFTGDYDSAIADYTEAIRLDPKNAMAYYDRGLAYRLKGQRAAAERDYAQAKRLGYDP